MSEHPETSVYAWRVLLRRLDGIEAGAEVTVDLIRDECDAAGLTSAEKSGALKHACHEGYLTGETVRDDGRRVHTSMTSQHPAGKGRLVKVYTRTDKPIPEHVCQEVA